MDSITHAEIIVRAPLREPLIYRIPVELASRVSVGSRVLVPLRNRHTEGIVSCLLSNFSAIDGLSSVPLAISQLIEEPAIPKDLVNLTKFISNYYLVPPGDALGLMLPSVSRVIVQSKIRLTIEGKSLAQNLNEILLPATTEELSIAEWALLQVLNEKNDRGLSLQSLRLRLKKRGFHEEIKKGIARLLKNGLLVKDEVLKERTVKKKLIPSDPRISPGSSRLQLTEEQEQVLKPILQAIEKTQKNGDLSLVQPSQNQAFLLQGVTGSGKTEVYLRAIEAALSKEQTAIILVPEIALTPQLAERFQERFGHLVGVLHSALTVKERREVWQGLAKGEKRIALGPRSALFAPVHNLGVIIVDEEHDASFKQQEDVWYHGRDLALVRGQAAGAVVILGSATPSLESLALVESGKLRALHLTKRVSNFSMPQIQVIDVRKHFISPEDGFLSAPLIQAIEGTLQKQEQVILFLNRRGYATLVSCRGCGHRFECKNCAVGLIWHKAQNQLLCHYCGFHMALPEVCPSCQKDQIVRLGMGTQKIMEQLAIRFPNARMTRLDRDTATPKFLAQTIEQMQKRELDVLIGTQMLAKGHDFPWVTLVGVILADVGMHLPDFRAAERTFQLLTQVAGRSGRAERSGRVLIQTFLPDHFAIKYACLQDAKQFAQEELSFRKAKFYPPYSRMAALRLDGLEHTAVRDASAWVAQALVTLMGQLPRGVKSNLLGPAPAPISRLKGKIRYQLFLQTADAKTLHQLLQKVVDLKSPLLKTVRLHIDVDPISML